MRPPGIPVDSSPLPEKLLANKDKNYEHMIWDMSRMGATLATAPKTLVGMKYLREGHFNDRDHIYEKIPNCSGVLILTDNLLAHFRLGPSQDT